MLSKSFAQSPSFYDKSQFAKNTTSKDHIIRSSLTKGKRQQRENDIDDSTTDSGSSGLRVLTDRGKSLVVMTLDTGDRGNSVATMTLSHCGGALSLN